MIKQYYKSISFPKVFNIDNETKVIKLALNESESDLYQYIKDLSSEDLRDILQTNSFDEIEGKALQENRTINNYCLTLIKQHLNKKINLNTNSKTGTFANNKTEKIFGWYPYLEGYSYDFIEDIINQVHPKPKKIYEPFSGSGTTVIVAALKGIEVGYSEINPLMQFICQTKIESIQNAKTIIEDMNKVSLFFKRLKQKDLTSIKLNEKHKYMLEKGYFDENILIQFVYLISKIRNARLSKEIKNIMEVAIASITVKESNMIRRADLRKKKNNEFKEIEPDVITLFKNTVQKFIDDLDFFQEVSLAKTELISTNAKSVSPSNFNNYDAIITSPPYINGTNYFRNTKLELLILDFIDKEDDLAVYRDESITAGINNVSSRIPQPENLTYLSHIIYELENDNYDSRIPKLVKSYFSDMKIVFKNSFNLLNNNSDCFIDIGDSKFKNTHIPADKIYEEIAKEIGFSIVDKIVLRSRFSKDGTPLKQYLLHFKKISDKNSSTITSGELVKQKWENFRDNLPYKEHPYSKRNWGNSLHSLCSYQGKLKPSLAHFLISEFTTEDMTVLDTFSGVGTIPFEGALQGRKVIGNDLSKVAYANSLAKIGDVCSSEVEKIIISLDEFIKNNIPSNEEVNSININFNKTIQEYFHPNTFKQIVAARNYFIKNEIKDANMALVFSSLLHILHGNRPYALSRTSHPITPFAPKGDFIDKGLIEKLKEKVSRSLIMEEKKHVNTSEMILGDIFELDKKLPKACIDSIITSPPFFDSTKFYLANWMRLWFAGWDKKDFDLEKEKYLETKQIKNIDIYDDYFRICHFLLKKHGTVIMHLGVSKKANMGEMIRPYAEKYFKLIGMFIEDVDGSEKFGIKDQGSVKGHQFMFLEKI